MMPSLPYADADADADAVPADGGLRVRLTAARGHDP